LPFVNYLIFALQPLQMCKPFPLFLIVLLLGCANPYHASNRIYKKQVKRFTRELRERPPDYFAGQTKDWAGTVNFDMRKPDFIIIHHTAQDGCPETLHTFTVKHSKVSAHYVICRDGTVHHMLNDYFRAWQAGLSKWGHNTDINSCSIGIELDNNGFEDFTAPQINSLLLLLDTLKTKYRIPQENIIGHGDIAPGRKVDPNWRFPWQLLAEHGFGEWYDDTTCVVVPQNFNPYQALRNIGYNLRDTLAVVNAFRRHWMQDTVYRPMDSISDKILYNLAQKYQ
jgi:N-acetylmuramoyl-L-alanine amidase